MLSLVMKHTELKSLTWSLNEFSRLVVDGCVPRPQVWRVCIRVALFGKVIYIPICGVK